MRQVGYSGRVGPGGRPIGAPAARFGDRLQVLARGADGARDERHTPNHNTVTGERSSLP